MNIELKLSAYQGVPPEGQLWANHSDAARKIFNVLKKNREHFK